MRASTITVYVQNWIESERGWGQRPDGFSIHVNKPHAEAFVRAYNAKYNNKAVAPDSYTRADGEPIAVEVDKAFYTEISRHCSAPDKAVWGNGSWYSPSQKLEL